MIERTYNGFYLVCLAIFTLAFWSIVYGTANLRRDAMAQATLPRGLRAADNLRFRRPAAAPHVLPAMDHDADPAHARPRPN
ncbi:hypothetical protein E3O42_05190 [Cryobacterium adonitolivorans]|uniref:Uncharacterized protein n=1 Tax=Cryobacterium adonitolivorans TaxID=1259189 RepID=A0A4R8WBS6_9MICO|nr:hypothetical protein [Cryobacterium adonitolivorans]TFC04390.1 hypothetical protein E3O42_05190 [Cryobacterium adonitolivorans]